MRLYLFGKYFRKYTMYKDMRLHKVVFRPFWEVDLAMDRMVELSQALETAESNAMLVRFLRSLTDPSAEV